MACEEISPRYSPVNMLQVNIFMISEGEAFKSQRHYLEHHFGHIFIYVYDIYDAFSIMYIYRTILCDEWSRFKTKKFE